MCEDYGSWYLKPTRPLLIIAKTWRLPRSGLSLLLIELELELIQTQMTQKPMLRAEVGMRVRCANKANRND